LGEAGSEQLPSEKSRPRLPSSQRKATYCLKKDEMGIVLLFPLRKRKEPSCFELTCREREECDPSCPWEFSRGGGTKRVLLYGNAIKGKRMPLLFRQGGEGGKKKSPAPSFGSKVQGGENFLSSCIGSRGGERLDEHQEEPLPRTRKEEPRAAFRKKRDGGLLHEGREKPGGGGDPCLIVEGNGLAVRRTEEGPPAH